MIDIDIVTNADGWDALPDAINIIHRAIAAAAAQQKLKGDVTVVLTDNEEIRALNRDWRGFDKPTNVLSFPAAPIPGEEDQPSLGDMVLAIETVQREAAEEGKSLAEHVSD